ncbi:GNAT family N-acetyltransferase [Formosa sp. PL04]|uniref:GNAT family N-acetyltransferase n=1 Tax=Formosa sp. PL04 TaxID=3081755 RepID=UPI00298164ED|nr:GNAT family N-acetyltransferase [Formosa sp. PL04]MDW5291037.1 GNAT family N-acetyltransferase [Formosa sp. PL04]
MKKDTYNGMPSTLFKTENPFITIKNIEAQETYSVRQPVLRPGRPIKDCEFVNDTHPTTFHLGLYFKSDLVGVVTFMKTLNETFVSENQYQLRGMAILSEHQGLQYGNILIQVGESIVEKQQDSLIWLNAREIAVKFYERNGYKISGNAFNIPKVGTHYMMYKTISNL